MLRRIHPIQPNGFKFSATNMKWAKEEIKKYPSGRKASAVIPILWKVQEQEGWVSRPAIDCVAKILEMDPIRVLEVASFYFMFHLSPVGDVAHIQVCGTTSCMLSGSEDLIKVCKEEISQEPHSRSSDGKFSWEEVECLGACANAPIVQIGKDYFEDLSEKKFRGLVKLLKKGKIPVPGSQVGRFSCEPGNGQKSLQGKNKEKNNASVQLALRGKDTVFKKNKLKFNSV